MTGITQDNKKILFLLCPSTKIKYSRKSQKKRSSLMVRTV